MSRLQQDFTQGSIGRQLIRFSVPFLLANVLQAMYNAADMWIVGWFCDNRALSGVTIGGQVTNLVVMIVSGLTVGGTVLVAQYFGAHKEEDVRDTIGTLFSTLAIAGVALSIAALLGSSVILRAINTPAESIEDARAYLNICLLGTVFIFGFNAISSVQRGMGDSQRPLVFVAVACGLNVVLDILFVGPLGLRAAGAAWATVIAQGVSMLLSTRYLMANRFIFDFKRASFRIRAAKLRMLVRLGLPSCVQSVVANLSFLLMTSLVNGFGVDASAAVGVASKLNSFGILPAIAMSSAVSAMVAQNIGAGRPERAQQALRTGTLIALTIGASMFALAQCYPDQLLGIFAANQPTTVSRGVPYLRAFSADYLLVSVLFCVNGLINGAGYTLYSLMTSVLSAIALRMPVAWFLSKTTLGLAGVGLAAPIASAGACVLALVFYLSGKWKVSPTGIVHADAGL